MTDRTDLPTLAAPDDDPWIWLEDVEGERATAWVDARTADTVARFGGPRRDADAAALAALLDRPDKIPAVTRRGDRLFNFWQDAANPRGLWRRTTLASYRRPEPEWETILDVDALARAEGEDWVYAGASVEPTRRARAVLRLSRGGSDAVVLREFDIPSRAFVPDGFEAAEAKGGDELARPRHAAAVQHAAGRAGRRPRPAPAMPAPSGCWRRGQAVADAPVVFAVDEALDGAAWRRASTASAVARAARLVSWRRIAFFDSVGLDRRRSRAEAAASTCRPTPTGTSTATCCW